MPTLLTKRSKYYIIKQLQESLDESSPTRMYLFVGNNKQRANANAAFESIDHEIDYWKEMVAAKRIMGSDSQLVIPRINWTANTMYDAWNSSIEDIHTSNCYVFSVNSGSVYLCIDNGASSNAGFSCNSTVEPSTTGTTIEVTTDRYKWKKLYDIDGVSYQKFVNDDWIPVLVDTTVKNNTVDGSIENIFIDNRGSYDGNVNAYFSVVSKDLTINTCYGYLEIASNGTTNVINSIQFTDHGNGYRDGNVIWSYSGAGNAQVNASLRISVTPYGGHGYNPPKDLQSKWIMFNCKFNNNDSKIFVGDKFYMKGLLIDPIDNSNNLVATASVYNQCVRLNLGNSEIYGTFSNSDVVLQSIPDNGAKANVVWYDSTNKYLYVNNVVNNFEVSNANADITVIGNLDGSAKANHIGHVLQSELIPYSGDIIFIDNDYIGHMRNSGQGEDFKIVIEF